MFGKTSFILVWFFSFLENAADSDAIIAAFGSDELAFSGKENDAKAGLRSSRIYFKKLLFILIAFTHKT